MARRGVACGLIAVAMALGRSVPLHAQCPDGSPPPRGRAATRAQIWGDVIDRASSDLLTVESDIARAVTTAITGQLLPAERARLARPVTTDPIAYEEYLRGMRAVNTSYDEASLPRHA